MTTLQDKFNKLYSARAKLEVERNNIYCEINNAVDKQDSKVKIERLIVKCKDAFTRVVDKNEELFDLAQRTEDPDAACKNLERWLETVTKKTDEFIPAARGYINSVHDKETAELYTSPFKIRFTYDFLKKIKSASTRQNYQDSKGRNLRNNMRQSFALLDSVLKLKNKQNCGNWKLSSLRRIIARK